MWDRLITLIFALLALLIAMDSFQQWRLKGKLLLIPACALGILTTIAMFYQWGAGFALLGLTMLVRIIAGFLPVST